MVMWLFYDPRTFYVKIVNFISYSHGSQFQQSLLGVDSKLGICGPSGPKKVVVQEEAPNPERWQNCPEYAGSSDLS